MICIAVVGIGFVDGIYMIVGLFGLDIQLAARRGNVQETFAMQERPIAPSFLLPCPLPPPTPNPAFRRAQTQVWEGRGLLGGGRNMFCF